MASFASPTTSEPGAATNSDGFSCFLSNNLNGRLVAYHIDVLGV